MQEGGLWRLLGKKVCKLKNDNPAKREKRKYWTVLGSGQIPKKKEIGIRGGMKGRET